MAPELKDRPTIATVLPWNQDKKPLERYDLSWQATPKPHPGKGLSLTEIFWAYNFPNSAYSLYPGIEAYTRPATRKSSSEDGTLVRIAFDRPGFAAYIADVAIERAARLGADGVFLDGWIDHSRRGFPKPRQRAARQAIARQLQARGGPGFIILGNVNWSTDVSTHDALNGVYLELLKEPDRTYTDDELARIEALLALHDTALRPPKIVALEAWRLTSGDAARDAPVNDQMARLFAAMAMVVPRNGYVIYADNNSDTKASDHDHVYYDFYDIDLGGPVSHGMTIAPGVAYKMFETGVIVYNRTAQDVTLRFDGFAPIAARARSGRFCLRLERELDCDL
ncbi:hypothetical protein PGB28_14265 [Primorskyibacter aestuariivivens]|uniref:hypothetical protein n=1 Tax=Primorskyibacter aestuariivivens TaxID=1888912 RepID=UPI0022FFC844|nr:hypothetical protein [Primorskyibacter aestuariivivens]MDA7429631.1 hypothetical protein [Primorskyibacter aestuariivivens]